MALPLSYAAVTVADNTVKPNGEPETSTWAVPITTLTPANVAATEGLVGTLMAAVQGVTLGLNQTKAVTYSRTLLAQGPAASVLAQRENKWLARYHDATNFQKFNVSFPCADLSKLASGEEFLDLSAGVGLAVKDAFEAVVVSPNDSSHAVVLDTLQFVGRNS
jgi:hypothetical protein